MLVSLNAMVEDWRAILSRLEKAFSMNSSRTYKYYLNKHEDPFETVAEEETMDTLNTKNIKFNLKKLLHTAIGSTYVISSMFGYHESMWNDIKQKERAQCEVTCGYCSAKGMFFDKSKKVFQIH